MLDMNTLATLLMTTGLVGGAALALWQLPWSERDLRQAREDAKAAASRLGTPAPNERRLVRVHAR